MIHIEFSDREYRFEHGKSPKGRGWWIFTFEGYEFCGYGTLTEAKSACRKHIRSIAPEGYSEPVIVNIEP